MCRVSVVSYTGQKMNVRPSIGIPVPTSFDPAYNDQSWPEYARAVEQSGGVPVRIELGLDERELRSAIAKIDGVLLPGSGADVNPARYGHLLEPETAPADALRESTDLLLLEAVEREKKPLLAICFGLQSLNVHRGGTLIQHLQPVPVNHRAGRAVAAAHGALIAGDSRLGRTAAVETTLSNEEDRFGRLMINSSHHQAVGAPGDGLLVTARSAEDGVIEALEDEDHPWMLGIQWHPERTMDTSAASRAIFHAFVTAAGEGR